MTDLEIDSSPSAGPATRPRRLRWWWGALAGALAVAAALAAGELVTGILEGTSSSVVSVGEVVVQNAPNWLKEFAIERFGSNDKDALIAGTTITLIIVSIVLGIASIRRLWIGVAGTVLFGVIGAWAALTRPGASLSDIWPSVIGTAAGVGVLVLLLGHVFVTRPGPARSGATPGTTGTSGTSGTSDPIVTPVATGTTGHATGDTDREISPEMPAVLRAGRTPGEGRAPAGFDRRGFLVTAGFVAGGAVIAGGLGRKLQGRYDISGARAAVQLPAPASPAAALPAGTDFGVAGISPFVTANGDFYRVDTALVAPRITPSDWKLKITGMVDNPFEISFEELLNRDLIERDITLVCVSNEVGGQYAGTARWLGVPLKDLLEEAGVQAGSDQLVSRSVDDWTAGSPVELVMDGRDAMVAIGMNGEPLPVEHGFPARLVVPGLYGFTSATKWVTELELTTFDAYDAYWLRRGWAQIAPIKTMARIDTPKGLGKVNAGTVPIGGIAWAIHRGVSGVQVKIDDGDWQDAQLASVPGVDTWVQWMLPWDATSGRHTITARGIDAAGELQPEERKAPIPDGAQGWHQIVVNVP